jgi:hypothetical protein
VICGQWFSPGTPVSSTNKTDHHDITEVLLKVALNTINKTTFKTTDLPQVTEKLYPIILEGGTPRLSVIRTHNVIVVIGTDCMGDCKSNYSTITTTTTPYKINTQ